MPDNAAPHTGSWLIAYNGDVDETEDAMVSRPCYVGGFTIGSVDATAVYVQFYNALPADITVGTTTPLMLVGIGPTDGETFNIPGGAFFDTAVSVAATTDIGGNTGPGAEEVAVTLFYY